MDTNTLYYGDNLEILRKYIPDETIDLIYLDPPFNSQASYNVLFKEPTGDPSEAQITAFEDTWHWTSEAEKTFAEIVTTAPANVVEMMKSLRSFIGNNDMMAYLCMMCIRLVELRRVLKSTGTLYLHCDPTASHYLKIILDTIFGVPNIKNEIVWMRTTSKGLMTRRLASNHDILFVYQKTDDAGWNAEAVFQCYDLDNLDAKTQQKYCLKDADGRLYQLTDITNPNHNRPNLTYEFLGMTKVWRWTKERMQAAYDAGLVVQPRPGAVPRLKRYLDEQRGKPLGDVWTDIPPINSQAAERLGYPTQKPEALLERAIELSSDEGQTVLDPFCGCGTALVAAHHLKRKWIGIDITHLAISTMKWRLTSIFPSIEFDTIGEPKDMTGAKALATQDKYQFQWWALSLIGAKPYGDKKKGADTGIDGYLYFSDEKDKVKRAIVSVKGGGNVSVPVVRELGHVVDREEAELGILITLNPPTKPMLTEAAAKGLYVSPLETKHPKLQILTIDELLHKTKPDIPPWVAPMQAPPKGKKEKGSQGKLAMP